MPPRFLDLIYFQLALLYLPYLLYQMIVLKKNRRGWRERFGYVKRRVGSRPCIWIHAVSLGEVNATRRLVEEIERRLPAYEVVVSATTDTGYAAACRHYHPKQVFRYPLDFSFVVGRVLDRIRPDAVVLMELEVWPNLVALATRRGIPIGIANGRVTEARSMRRFRRPILRGLSRRMFGRIAWTGAQDPTYADRFAELGVPRERLTVTGTMKYDTAVMADGVPGDERLAQALGLCREAPLVVAGSTGPGEEALVLDAYAALRGDHPDLQLAIVPRKPERFDEVARLMSSRGLAFRRRSEHPDGVGGGPAGRGAVGGGEGASPRVVLGDTVGELRKFYALADCVFVGRSLVPMGGSDMTEVAGLGRAMCFGPHVENFADVAEKLTAADAAVQLGGAEDLAPALRRAVEDKEWARAVGERARDVVRRNTGATKKTVDLLCASLGRSADHPVSSISTAQLR